MHPVDPFYDDSERKVARVKGGCRSAEPSCPKYTLFRRYSLCSFPFFPKLLRADRNFSPRFFSRTNISCKWKLSRGQLLPREYSFLSAGSCIDKITDAFPSSIPARRSFPRTPSNGERPSRFPFVYLSTSAAAWASSRSSVFARNADEQR